MGLTRLDQKVEEGETKSRIKGDSQKTTASGGGVVIRLTEMKSMALLFLKPELSKESEDKNQREFYGEDSKWGLNLTV